MEVFHSLLEAIWEFIRLLIPICNLIALFFIWKQLKNVDRHVLSTTYQNIYTRMIEIDRFFIENPDLKTYFYNNEEPPKSTKENKKLISKLESTAEMLVDYFDSVYYQRDCMKRETFEAKAFYFGYVYNNSPILQDYLAKPGLDKWYAQEFLNFLKDEAKKSKKYLEKNVH